MYFRKCKSKTYSMLYKLDSYFSFSLKQSSIFQARLFSSLQLDDLESFFRNLSMTSWERFCSLLLKNALIILKLNKTSNDHNGALISGLN